MKTKLTSYQKSLIKKLPQRKIVVTIEKGIGKHLN